MVNMNTNLEVHSFTCFRYLKVRHVILAMSISEVVCLPRVLVMVALCNRADHNIFMLFILLFFPRLISAVGDWMFTILCLAHGVALVRI